MKTLLALLVLALLPGCTAFRRDFDSVSAYGGYTTERGDSYKAGVSAHLRKPSPK